MASNSLPFGYTMNSRSSRKRNYEQISSSHSRSGSQYISNRWPSEDPSSSNGSTATSQTSQPHYPSLDNIRFPGDGLDYRRPIRSQNHQEAVIDLTEESPPQVPRNMSTQTEDAPTSRATRPPRFDRDIIDVDDLPMSQETSSQTQSQAIDLTQDDSPTHETAPPRSPSPDVEFVSERQIHNPDDIPFTLGNFLLPPLDFQHQPRGLVPSPHHRALAILNREARNRPTGHLRRHVQSLSSLLFSSGGGGSGNSTNEVFPHPGPAPHYYDSSSSQGGGGGGGSAYRGVRPPTPAAFPVDININPEDFQVVGFDIGLSGGDGRSRNHRLRVGAGITPPPPAKEGFTRSPEEEDVLLCPICEHELGTGEDEVRRQSWCVKSCGHIYCGECAQNRGGQKKGARDTADNGKGKAKAGTKPNFTTCVVDGCGKRVSTRKQMIQLFT